MTKQFMIGASVLGAVLIATPIFARAQGTDIGKQEYQSHCAVCHGSSGKGDGPLAGILKKKIPDITMLRKNNKGVFPVQRVYDIIDGVKPVEGHGTRDMPVWGNVYMKQAPAFVSPYAQAEFVTARILALIGYMDSLQAK
jgi:mono/diheme cytochrome c family protein